MSLLQLFQERLEEALLFINHFLHLPYHVDQVFHTHIAQIPILPQFLNEFLLPLFGRFQEGPHTVSEARLLTLDFDEWRQEITESV